MFNERRPKEFSNSIAKSNELIVFKSRDFFGLKRKRRTEYFGFKMKCLSNERYEQASIKKKIRWGCYSRLTLRKEEHTRGCIQSHALHLQWCRKGMQDTLEARIRGALLPLDTPRPVSSPCRCTLRKEEYTRGCILSHALHLQWCRKGMQDTQEARIRARFYHWTLPAPFQVRARFTLRQEEHTRGCIQSHTLHLQWCREGMQDTQEARIRGALLPLDTPRPVSSPCRLALAANGVFSSIMYRICGSGSFAWPSDGTAAPLWNTRWTVCSIVASDIKIRAEKVLFYIWVYTLLCKEMYCFERWPLLITVAINFQRSSGNLIFCFS